MSDDRIGWVPEPNCGRGTMSIIWSCLATTALCTYSALHLDAPRRSGKWYSFGRTVGYTFLGIMAPEAICYNAIEDYYRMRSIRQQARDEGLALSSLQAHFIGMKGIILHQTPKKNEPVQKTILTKRNFLIAITTPEIRARLPSDEEIEARSKSNLLTKCLTVSQILWFTTQATARHFQHKDVSLLEVSILAYICLAIITYAFYLRKPQDVTWPFIIEVNEEVELSSDTCSKMTAWLHNIVLLSVFGIFSGIHCFAWNYAFPSGPEQWGYRVCAIIVFAAGFIFNGSLEFDANWVITMAVVVYLIARTFLMVEAFLAFRSAPLSIYETINWSLYFPMLG